MKPAPAPAPDPTVWTRSQDPEGKPRQQDQSRQQHPATKPTEAPAKPATPPPIAPAKAPTSSVPDRPQDPKHPQIESRQEAQAVATEVTIAKHVEEEKKRKARSRAARRDESPAAVGRRRTQQRRWKKVMEGAADAQRLAAQTDVRALLELKKTAADSAAQRGGAARRKALQAHTPSVYKNREEKRWQEALSHETPRPPPKATMEEVGEYKLGRALVVPVRFGEPIFENRQQIAEYLTEFSARNPLIDEKNQIAHLVVSWEADSVHPGAMVATADRMLRRLGIDSDENRVVALAHLDGQHAHLHLLVGRTRSDGGMDG